MAYGKTKASTPAAGMTALDYGSLESGGVKRRAIQSRNKPEAMLLTPAKREKATATARDDRRNMAILAWMVRRHLDNVSRFTPQFRIPNGGAEIAVVNNIVNRLLLWHGKRRNFDALGRHGRDEWMRMFEACKVIDGDVAGLKVKGGLLQGIEGNRIAKASDATDKDINDEGLVISNGTVIKYAICSRDKSMLKHERIVSADNMIFDAYWPERFDGFRGVSPLLSALNEGADIRETREWLILKAKASAIFGLAFKRASSDEMFPQQGEANTAAPGSGAASYTSQVAKAIAVKGIVNLDLDPGDDVHEIQSSSPNPTVVEFTRELIRSFLLALDIPFTFYDSLTASFSARVADRNEYEEACEWKRDKNIDVLDAIYADWLFPMWFGTNKFGLQDACDLAKIDIEEVASYLRWCPAGRPWLDKSNEMSGHIMALAAGVTSIPEICAAYGRDAYAVAAEQKEYLENCGIPILYANGGQVSVQNLLDNELAKQSEEKK